MFRNYIEEWLEVFPIKLIYDKLSNAGEYPKWKRHLMDMMKDEFNHPMTVVMLHHKPISEVIKYIQPLMEKLKDEKQNWSFGHWLEQH